MLIVQHWKTEYLLCCSQANLILSAVLFFRDILNIMENLVGCHEFAWRSGQPHPQKAGPWDTVTKKMKHNGTHEVATLRVS